KRCGPGALPRGHRVLLARVGPEERSAAHRGALAACAWPWRRCLAVDQRPRPSSPESPYRGPDLPLALAERVPVPDLQTNAGQGQVAQPQGTAGAPRGGTVVAGLAIVVGRDSQIEARRGEGASGDGEPTANGAAHPGCNPGDSAHRIGSPP